MPPLRSSALDYYVGERVKAGKLEKAARLERESSLSREGHLVLSSVTVYFARPLSGSAPRLSFDDLMKWD